MELKNLRTFAVVADVGSISSASKTLHCVQSNITTRIKSLETELGVSLFNRSRSGMSLTSAGVAFLPYARDVILAEEKARLSLHSFASSVKLLRIGSMETTLAIRLPKVFGAFRKKHPDLRLHIHSGPTDELTFKLLDNQIDLALVGGKFTHPKLKGHALFAEEMVMISAKGISDTSKLRSMPVIVFKQGCSYRDYTRRWMRQSGLAPNETFELGTLDGILGCVASGVGITCLPRSVIEGSHHRDILAIHQLEDPERFIDTYAMENRSSVKNGAVDAFVQELRSTEFPI